MSIYLFWSHFGDGSIIGDRVFVFLDTSFLLAIFYDVTWHDCNS